LAGIRDYLAKRERESEREREREGRRERRRERRGGADSDMKYYRESRAIIRATINGILISRSESRSGVIAGNSAIAD